MYRLIIKDPAPDNICAWCEEPLKDGEEVYVVDGELHHEKSCMLKCSKNWPSSL